MMEVIVVKKIHLIHGIAGAICVNVLRRLLCYALLVMVLVTILMGIAIPGLDYAFAIMAMSDLLVQACSLRTVHLHLSILFHSNSILSLSWILQ